MDTNHYEQTGVATMASPMDIFACVMPRPLTVTAHRESNKWQVLGPSAYMVGTQSRWYGPDSLDACIEAANLLAPVALELVAATN